MRTYLMVFLYLAVISLAQGCVAMQSDPPPTLVITDSQLEWVGRQVFRNECDLRPSCLVHWNRGEPFPSLGIGHFIWYPVGGGGPFVESFPSLVAYMGAQDVDVPQWLLRQAPEGAPWPDREAFLRAEQEDSRVDQLRQLLSATPAVQAAFLMSRARDAMTDVVAASDNPGRTRAKINALTMTPGGTYALIDYVNFKGEGLAESERYRGVGWGLLQVLEAMPEKELATVTVLEQFREAAAKVLTSRAELAERPIEREQWLAGWLKRVDTYREPDDQ
ncbi:hypothetical protein ACFOZ5_06460 [Marinobacter lacisalsi]|uniref:Lipoprotein n=1 Tax=Marinobacter lacisalsi TaxID=475979 RepID=A0ABV8QE93_9GAMM